MNGAAAEKSPGTRYLARAPGARPARPRHGPGACVTRAPAAREQPFGVVAGRHAARPRSCGRRRRAPRAARTTSPGRSRRGARSGCRGERRRRRRAARCPSSSRPCAHLDAAARRSARSGRRRSDSSPVSSKRPSWPARSPASSRSSVPALPQSIGLRRFAQSAQAGAVDPQLVDVVLVDADAERADGRDRGLGVCRAAEARDPRLAVGDRAEQHGAVRDRLVAGHARCARESPSRARSSFGQHRARRRRRSPATPAAPPPARPRSSPVTSSVSVPPRSGETWCSSKSSMLIRSAPSACVIPASTPGRSGTCTRSRWSSPGSGNASASIRRRLPAASPIQRARKPASPASSAASSCSTRRRCSASDSRSEAAFSRKMSTQIRGFAPATRVMSRSEPPAAASGSWPSTRVAPAWLTSRFASACGRWLVSATSRSCACGSTATGVAPSAETKPWTSR